MEFQLTTASGEPIYRQLMRQVREGVALGRLQPGAQLPSVRELSRALVVNPNTIARAWLELEREGVVNNHQGKGVFVAPPTNDLTKTARRKKLVEQLDALLTLSVHLGFTRDEVVAAVKERAERFQWPNES